MFGDFGRELNLLLCEVKDFSDLRDEAVSPTVAAAESIISLLVICVSLLCVLQSSDVKDSSIEHSSSVVGCSFLPSDEGKLGFLCIHSKFSSENIPPSWVSEIVFIGMLHSSHGFSVSFPRLDVRSREC